MKTTRPKIALSAFIALIAVFTSCESEQQPAPPEAAPEQTGPETVINKLDPSTVELDMADAATVAGIYAKNDAVSRSGDAKTVKNIVAINDSVGNPAIYAVNFEDGYILVSATQKFFPIIAEIEHGTLPPMFWRKPVWVSL